MTKRSFEVPVFTTQKISKTRVAIFENGEYCCQLRPNEVDSWLFRARKSAEKFAQDEKDILGVRVMNALEYLEKRMKREQKAAKQLSLF